MSWKKRFPIHATLIALLLSFSVLGGYAAGPTGVALSNSIAPVAVAPQTGPIDPLKAVITSTTVTADDNTKDLEFEVALKMRNYAELQARVAKGEKISSQEMAAKYDPLPADYDATVQWLTHLGLTITQTDSHHMIIFVTGTVGKVASALQVSFAKVAFNNKAYTSAVTAPNVPSTLAPVLLGINGLQPHVQAHKHVISKSSQANPNTSPGSHSYLPAQIAKAYGVTGLYNSNVTGAGQSIAIVIDAFPVTSDLVAFWQEGAVNQTLNNMQFIQVVPPGTQTPDLTESTLDVEWSSAMAPSAHVRVYATTDLSNSHLDEGYQQVYEDVTNHPELGIHQMSMSYGVGETLTTSSQVNTDGQFFTKLAAAGVTIFASAGDDGSTPGENPGDVGSVQAESPSSDPNVTGVGGTTLKLDSNNNISTETVWNNGSGVGATGGGTSIYFARPTWQTGTGVPSGNKRLVPDVAAAADPDYGAVIFLDGSRQIEGGTSWSSPTWAGLCALMNQARSNAGQAPLGILGPSIYPLLNGGSYTSYFNDITSGNNATFGSNGLYTANTGYDETTGLGSPKTQSITQGVLGTAALVGIAMPAPMQSVIPGQNATFTVTVTGETPTYQWQRMPVGTSTWTNLTDGLTYSGTLTASLTVSNTTLAMSGDEFQCLVSLSPTNIVTTNPPSVLIVDQPYKVATVAGQVGVIGKSNATGLSATFNYPSGVAIDQFGDTFIGDSNNNEIREVSPGGIVICVYGSTAGTAGSTNGTGNSAQFNDPNGLAMDSSDTLYVADTGNNLIRKVTSAGMVSTFVAASAGLNAPQGVAVDGSGNLYVADSGNNTIRKVTSSGVVTTYAGQKGVAGYAEGNATTVALFNDPTSVVVDSNGNVFVADSMNSIIRKITPGGVVSTVAGIPSSPGYQDGSGAIARFNEPISLAIDEADNIFVADRLATALGTIANGNNLLRKITPAGVVSTLAGQVEVAGSGNGVGTAAQFNGIKGMAVNNVGTLYISDTFNQTIRTAAENVPTKLIALRGSLAFGNVQPGSPATKTLTISNSGNTDLTVSSIDFPAGFSGSWTSGTVAAGSSVNVTVTFSPTALVSYGGIITVNSDADQGTNTIAVSGMGAIVPTQIIALSGNLDFGALYLKTTLTRTMTISNTGNSTLNISKIGYPAGFSGDLTPPIMVASGASQDVMVTFAPTVVSTYGGNIVIYSDATSGVSTIPCSGQGLKIPAAPTLTSPTATNITVSSATLNSSVNPKGTDTSVAFQYGTTNAYGTTTASQDMGAGTKAVPFSADILGLQPQTTYHFRVQATYVGYVLNGPDKTFVTPPVPLFGPAISAVGGTGTTVQQTLNTGGVATMVYYKYGTTTAYANQTPTQTVNTKVLTPVYAQFSDLLPNTTYHYQMFTNGAGSGLDETFTTLPLATTPVAVKGDSAMGVGATYSLFGNPAINDSDDVAFAGTLTTGSGITTTNNFGIWADDSGHNLQLLVLKGSTLAPGTNSTFATLSDPVYNNFDEVAFRGVLKVASGQATSATAAGIWTGSGTTLTKVAQQGDQAPDCPVGATFSGFTSLGLPDQGGVVMLATLNANKTAGVTTANNSGIWAGNTPADLQLLVRLGDAPNGSAITKLTFLPSVPYVSGQTRSFSETTGDIVYSATYADKTSGFSKISPTSWTPTGNMNYPRDYHAASSLPNGKVLVTGGLPTTSSSTAEVFDPATGSWTVTPTMISPHAEHTSILLNTGKVLVVGGTSAIATAELYDSTTGTWAATGAPGVSRHYHAATLLSNGQVLVTGGEDSNLVPLATAELYDPTTGMWTATGSMTTARFRHTATLLPNGQVLIAGGKDSLTEQVSCELYDPVAGTFSSTGSMQTPRYEHTATLLGNGTVLVAGGFPTQVTAELYDPTAGTWSAAANLIGGRQQQSATLLGNGEVLLAGGGMGNPVDTTLLYDPNAGTWSPSDILHTARSSHTATLLPDGSVLVAGGFFSRPGVAVTGLASAEIYPGVNAPKSSYASPLLVLTGDPAQGVSNGVTSGTYSILGNPVINSAGHTAFAATLTTNVGGVTTANNFGIWADDSSARTNLIARKGFGTAPGTSSATYATLSDPVYNNNHDVAFRGTLNVFSGQVTLTTAAGIWATTAGTLNLVARQGSQAAGCIVGATFNTFTALALPDQGGAIFLGTLNNNATAKVTASNNTGIWAVDVNGDLQLVARTGDMLDNKIITGLTFLPTLTIVNGQSRSFSPGVGDVTYLATFSDKSTGIFKVVFR